MNWNVNNSQQAGSAGRALALVALGAALAGSCQAREEASIVREFTDPHTRAHWLLLREAGHGGGPGRLVAVMEAPAEGARSKGLPNLPEGVRSASGTASNGARLVPVIHSGDRVIVEQHTPLIDARLEAVAMAPAAHLARFPVRLKPSGKVVQAVALGPGLAGLVQEAEARP